MVGSPPSRGAWIEISAHTARLHEFRESPPSRGAWIEIEGGTAYAAADASPPSWGAWIEIACPVLAASARWRRPPRGGVK